MARRDPLPPAVPVDRVKRQALPGGAPTAELEGTIGYRFADPALLREALTHGSAATRGRRSQRSNERLEFLGDRVLALAVAELLLRRYPHEPEGALSPRLSLLVSEPVLAEVARALGLGRQLKVARSEEEAGGRERPAILADALEALIGAVYLDGGWEAAAGIVRRWLGPRLETMAVPPRDAKSRLQEWTQGRGLGLPRYRVVEIGGPAHAPRFEVAASVAELPPVNAVAGSKQAAEQAAAEQLLAALESAGG